jgi:aspartate racemase
MMVADMQQRIVGVIGGLGPEATLDFFAKVLALTPATTDQDHLHLIVNNNPKVPNRNEAVAGTGPSAGPALAASAAALERAGADFLVMVCNAAHAFAADIGAAVSIPLVSIIDETVREARQHIPGVKRVGVLASSGCLDAGLYQKAFALHQIEVLLPEAAARAQFMELLYAIKSGDKGPAIRQEMWQLADGLIQQGAEQIIAGCTEVPLVLSQEAIAVPLLNSTDVLVKATIALALGNRHFEVS